MKQDRNATLSDKGELGGRRGLMLVLSSPAWANNSQTRLAHGTGRLPAHARQSGWQPVAGVGAAPAPVHLSSSMQSLRRRIVRGEA